MSQANLADSLGLAPDAIADIFVNDKGNDAFYATGQNKMDRVDYQQNNPGLDQSADKLIL